MILALALVTVTQLSPETTSARLLAPDTISVSGAPAREAIPGVKPAWVPMVVAGGITMTSAAVLLFAVVVGQIGSLAAVVLAMIAGVGSVAVHIICGVISAFLRIENEQLKAASEQRKRQAPPPVPVSSAPVLQPTTVVLRF